MTAINVLVTGVGGGGHGEQILKALELSSLELKLFGADMNAVSIGFAAVGEAFVLPAARDPAYLEALLDVCTSRRIAVLFHGSEPELRVMSDNRERIAAAGVFLPINSRAVLRMCLDKALTMDFLREHGFACPASRRITGMADLETLPPFPLVLKPSVGGGGSANTAIVQSDAELELYSRYLLDTYGEFIVQEYVGTAADEYTVGVLHDMDGELVNSVAVHKNILSSLGSRIAVPNRSGRPELGARLAISSGISQGAIGKYPAITAQCEAIAAALESRGPLNIQCRLVDGRVHVFEINPRYSGTTSMRALVGMNEPELMIRHHLLHEPIERNAPLTEGHVLRGLREVLIPAGQSASGDLPDAPRSMRA